MAIIIILIRMLKAKIVFKGILLGSFRFKSDTSIYIKTLIRISDQRYFLHVCIFNLSAFLPIEARTSILTGIIPIRKKLAQ